MVYFCSQCGNLMSHQIHPETQVLNYKCVVCHYIEPVTGHCLTVNQLQNHVGDYPISGNLIYDLTLARTKNLPCPNEECPDDADKEIVLFNYNPNSLRMGYMCTACLTHWKK